MSRSIWIEPNMPSRPCHFSLGLRDGRVFADFDVDQEGHVSLCRISFDGYGCCEAIFRKMNKEDSEFLLGRIDRGALEDVAVEKLLRTYFRKNADIIWADALKENELI